jgi:hypothetical protein
VVQSIGFGVPQWRFIDCLLVWYGVAEVRKR